MAVRAVYTAAGLLEPSALNAEPHSGLMRFLEGARRCHDLKDTGRPLARWLGDPMEIALVEAAVPYVPDEATKVDEIPFDSDRKRLVTVHRTGDGLVLYVKGALENVLPRCRWMSDTTGRQPLTSEDAQAFNDAQSAMATKGLRVLAFAHRRLQDARDPAGLEEDLVLDALAGLEDPPRPEVAPAVERCRRAGVRIVMVTGDHPQTALAIGREIGLFGATDPHVVTGDHVARMSDAQMWARCTVCPGRRGSEAAHRVGLPASPRRRGRYGRRRQRCTGAPGGGHRHRYEPDRHRCRTAGGGHGAARR
jgi:magnesium-transporting ATPase (P-type)